MIYKKIKSPIGNIYIFADNTGLKSLDFESSKYFEKKASLIKKIGTKTDSSCFEQAETICLKTEQQLQQYFNGTGKTFDVPLAPEGTDFQKKVWAFLYTIPYGKLVSYKTVAKGIGNPDACRAVGGANGKNPISIIIPCHRVISFNKSIGGYSSGLEIKKYLIKLENAIPVDNL